MLAAQAVADIRRVHQEAFESEAARFRKSPNPDRLLRALCKATDVSVRALWEQSEMPDSCCLVATGGYGRGELFPNSDVDLLIVCESDTTGCCSFTSETKGWLLAGLEAAG